MARPTLMTHPKFRRLCLILGEPRPHVRGYLELLWEVAYQSGNPIIGDEVDVALAAEYPHHHQDSPGKLAEALLEVRFLDRLEDGKLCVHDLFDHAPDYVQERARKESERKKDRKCQRCGLPLTSADPREKYCTNACKQAAYRQRGVGGGGGGGGDQDHAPPAGVTHPVTDRGSVTQPVTDRVTGDGSLRVVTVLPHAHPHAHTLPDSKTDCPETAEAAAPGRQSQQHGQVTVSLLTFPTDGPVKQWHLTEDYVAELQGAYPHLDVLGECRKSLVWVNANPARRKTARGMKQFLQGWMGRAQNSNNGGHSPSRPSGGADVLRGAREFLDAGPIA